MAVASVEVKVIVTCTSEELARIVTYIGGAASRTNSVVDVRELFESGYVEGITQTQLDGTLLIAIGLTESGRRLCYELPE